ncbi:DNA-binding response regulator [Polaribacter pacificus]|uniref:DNA-binding response regulator n=1 Tax=Polaribacter pacificus TaxID=1775173 RepID=A0A917MDT1_9FLAO|nr:LytTR family DNA-binding domain-containing protein [Polaribacter pacificus]GGG99901.1 DNA-binding response regulator [Polaribacter pacificus]
MHKRTAILVDDMNSALEVLSADLAQFHPEIEIIGKAKSVVDAAKLLRKQTPDFLFLDIMLGDGTGFDLLEIFPELGSKIIFVTASDAYAIRAFKFAAIDYILKPYSPSELEHAIQKATIQIELKKEQLNVLQQTIQQQHIPPTKISLHSLEKIVVVDIQNIIRCEAHNNYTQFFFENGSKVLVTKTLKYFADLLKENQFIRVHQSHLVNPNFIKEFIKSDGGYLILQNKESVPVSVRKRAAVLEAINNL